MDERKVNAFYEEHKMKTGKDYRLEVLKMSKEDIHECEVLFEKTINGALILKL